MQKYEITVRDSFFKQDLSGEFEAESQEAAISAALEFYAYELGTVADELEVVGVKVLGGNEEASAPAEIGADETAALWEVARETFFGARFEAEAEKLGRDLTADEIEGVARRLIGEVETVVDCVLYEGNVLGDYLQALGQLTAIVESKQSFVK